MGWITTSALLYLIFRARLRLVAETRDADRPPPSRLSRPARQFLAVMALGFACYPILSYANGPVWIVATATAALGVGLCWSRRVATPCQVMGNVSWDTLIFLFGVFVMVIGLRNVGLVERIVEIYVGPARQEVRIGLIAAISALGSAILNNHPMAILNNFAIRALPGARHQDVLAALIGGDLGPRLLPIGSLAGLMWMRSLGRMRVHVGVWHFVAVGLTLTIPTLAISLAVLLLLSP